MEHPVVRKTDGITVAFSGRRDGDMRHESNLLAFAGKAGFSGVHPVRPQQVHGSTVAVFAGLSLSRKIPFADGVVMKKNGQSVLLYALGADCVPIVFWDARAGVIGVIHAGWRGTVAGISGNAVNRMLELGAGITGIRVILGPAVAPCCYRIDDTRARYFRDNPLIRPALHEQNGTVAADLKAANRLTLEAAGIAGTNIESLDICTSCGAEAYFSYRQSQKYEYGENAALVGFL